MKTIQLRINDKVYDKFLWLLSKFSKDEIEIINENEDFITTQKYLQNEISEIENEKASFVSEEILESKLNTSISNKNETNWWSEMSDEEKEAIEIGLKQADKGILVSNEKVMQRFKKWH
jgi:hypothetical protein